MSGAEDRSRSRRAAALGGSEPVGAMLGGLLGSKGGSKLSRSVECHFKTHRKPSCSLSGTGLRFQPTMWRLDTV